MVFLQQPTLKKVIIELLEAFYKDDLKINDITNFSPAVYDKIPDEIAYKDDNIAEKVDEMVDVVSLTKSTPELSNIRTWFKVKMTKFMEFVRSSTLNDSQDKYQFSKDAKLEIAKRLSTFTDLNFALESGTWPKHFKRSNFDTILLKEKLESKVQTIFLTRSWPIFQADKMKEVEFKRPEKIQLSLLCEIVATALTTDIILDQKTKQIAPIYIAKWSSINKLQSLVYAFALYENNPNAFGQIITKMYDINKYKNFDLTKLSTFMLLMLDQIFFMSNLSKEINESITKRLYNIDFTILNDLYDLKFVEVNNNKTSPRDQLIATNLPKPKFYPSYLSLEVPEKSSGLSVTTLKTDYMNTITLYNNLRNKIPFNAIKLRFDLQNMLDQCVLNRIKECTNTYNKENSMRFYISFSMAMIGLLAVTAFLNSIILSSTLLTYIMIPNAISSFLYAQYLISRDYPFKETNKINVSRKWLALNIGYTFVSAVIIALTSYFLYTALIPFTVVSSFLSLGAYYMHKNTSLNDVIPNSVKTQLYADDWIKSTDKKLAENMEIKSKLRETPYLLSSLFAQTSDGLIQHKIDDESSRSSLFEPKT